MTTVLVIDDSPTEMAKFKDVLVRNHFAVIEAMDGETGIQMAIDHVPDVILMDVVMPEMNGFQATRKITRNKTTAHIPVVIVSTKNQETDRVWGKRQGAKEYLTKPFREDELLQVISSVIPSNSKPKNPASSSITKQQSATQKPTVHLKTDTAHSARVNQSQQQSQGGTETAAPDNGIYL